MSIHIPTNQTHTHTFGDGLLLAETGVMPYRITHSDGRGPIPKGTPLHHIEHHLPLDTVLICDECGAAYVIVDHPAANVFAHTARRETRRERRRRLGLAWWQA